MSHLAIETKGTIIGIGDGGSPTETFNPIAEVKSFTGPGGSAAVIDVTDLDSVAREKRMGLTDEGTFSFEIHYIPQDTTHAQLRTDRANRTLRNFQVTFADLLSTTLSFAGYVTEFNTSGAVDDVVAASVSIEITGAVT